MLPLACVTLAELYSSLLPEKLAMAVRNHCCMVAEPPWYSIRTQDLPMVMLEIAALRSAAQCGGGGQDWLLRPGRVQGVVGHRL